MTTKKNPHAVALGRLGGAAKTPAQQAAARRNGAKGGRPISREKSVGIKRRGAGWQASVRVCGRFEVRQFPYTTSRATMQMWRELTRAAVLAAAEGDK